MKKLPVILITGFLGAGKTTFLNELLVHLRNMGLSPALLINEFGRANVDSSLVDSSDETIYEVNQGSIFCVCTRDQFIRALDGIARHDPPFDVAVIESTGMANTRDIGTYLDTPPLNGILSIRQNFCIIDTANFHKVFETLPAVRTQVEEASVCILNKADLAETSYLTRLEEMVAGLNPNAAIERAEFGKVDFSSLLDLDAGWQSVSALDMAPPKNIFSVTLDEPGVYDTDKVRHFLEMNGHTLLRAKGFLETHRGPVYIEFVGGDIFTRHTSVKNKARNLVLIGYNLDQEFLEDEFAKCRSNPPQ